jgi:hypothetical protein
MGGKIEMFHKVMKSGYRAKDFQLRGRRMAG